MTLWTSCRRGAGEVLAASWKVGWPGVELWVSAMICCYASLLSRGRDLCKTGEDDCQEVYEVFEEILVAGMEAL